MKDTEIEIERRFKRQALGGICLRALKSQRCRCASNHRLVALAPVIPARWLQIRRWPTEHEMFGLSDAFKLKI